MQDSRFDPIKIIKLIKLVLKASNLTLTRITKKNRGGVLVFFAWGSSIYRGGGLVLLYSISNSVETSAEGSFSEFCLRMKPVLK